MPRPQPGSPLSQRDRYRLAFEYDDGVTLFLPHPNEPEPQTFSVYLITPGGSDAYLEFPVSRLPHIFPNMPQFENARAWRSELQREPFALHYHRLRDAVPVGPARQIATYFVRRTAAMLREAIPTATRMFNEVKEALRQEIGILRASARAYEEALQMLRDDPDDEDSVALYQEAVQLRRAALVRYQMHRDRFVAFREGYNGVLRRSRVQ
jgi:hypothetical protein